MSPADEYRARRQARHAAHTSLLRADERMSHARLSVFGAAVLIAGFAIHGSLSGWWLAIPLVLFLALVQWHDRISRARDRAAAATAFYDWGLARLDDTWIGRGARGDRFQDDEHPYANDLDLFGSGSLFELLSLARTRGGEETLAGWLTAAASAPDITARQDAVRELASALDLRESAALAGTGADIQPEALVAWAVTPPELRNSRWVTWTLTLVTVATGVFWAFTGRGTLFVAAIVAQMVAAQVVRKSVDRILHAAEAPARELHVLLRIVECIEPQTFRSPRLAALAQAFVTRGVRASRAIGRLHQLVEMREWGRNIMLLPLAALLAWGMYPGELVLPVRLAFGPIAALQLWNLHLSLALEQWRRTYGDRIADWIAAAGEIEALLSLSAYAYEHPADPFPDLVVDADPAHDGRCRAVFEGTGLGHPLLPAARMVRNDAPLTGGTRLLLVSGSNMSGKSTLLRTVGINAVLALAGAPVRAASLRLSPLAVGATLRIEDSLREGRSRFYAEITRIRLLADLANGPLPLLFLLDELFHGTNSHDRLTGARGVLRSLLDRGAIGLVTTHDLAITAIADTLAPAVVNVHFEDWFEEGEMRFDYRMKPGPVTRSNAIALMRAVGLDVDRT